MRLGDVKMRSWCDRRGAGEPSSDAPARSKTHLPLCNIGGISRDDHGVGEFPHLAALCGAPDGPADDLDDPPSRFGDDANGGCGGVLEQ